MTYNHYFKNTKHLDAVDVYRVLSLYEVSNPCLQHAIKKLLCAGQRGGKDMDQDVREAIDALGRWQDMQVENELK